MYDNQGSMRGWLDGGTASEMPGQFWGNGGICIIIIPLVQNIKAGGVISKLWDVKGVNDVSSIYDTLVWWCLNDVSH